MFLFACNMCMLQAQNVISLAGDLQVHHCSKYCTDDVPPGEVCRKAFPRLLSLYDHMALKPSLATEEERAWYAQVSEFRGLVKKKMVLELESGANNYGGQGELRALLHLLSGIAEEPIPLPENGGLFYGGVEIPAGTWLDYHLQKAATYTQDPAERHILAGYHYLTSVARENKVQKAILLFSPCSCSCDFR